LGPIQFVLKYTKIKTKLYRPSLGLNFNAEEYREVTRVLRENGKHYA